VKKIGLAIFLALMLVSAVVLAEKDYWPVAQKALRDAEAASVSDHSSWPEGVKSFTVGCTLPVWQKSGKDPMWNVVKFEVLSEGGSGGIIGILKLVVITVDRKGRTVRNECQIDRWLVFTQKSN